MKIMEWIWMNSNEFEERIWYFYLELEEEFLQLEKIIPYDDINKNTFTYKYMALLQSICSEIETVFKKFIELKDNTLKKKKIEDYEKFIEKYYPRFKNSEITCYKHRFNNKRLKPYQHWNSDNSPNWWQVYNKIKHDRVKIKEEDTEWYLYANQKNVLKALGGLFILNMYFYREIVFNPDECEIPLPQSEIFNLENWGNYREKLFGNRIYLDLDTFKGYYN